MGTIQFLAVDVTVGKEFEPIDSGQLELGLGAPPGHLDGLADYLFCLSQADFAREEFGDEGVAQIG